MAVSEQQKKENIKELQRYLYRISLSDKRIPSVVADGIYDDETRDAVRSFQRSYGLPITGEVDQQTWEDIVKVYLELTIKPAEIRPFPSSKYVLREGDEGDLVYFLQVMLNSLAARFNNLKPASISGRYDRSTSDAVRELQKRAGLSETGSTDVNTWNRVVGEFNKANVNSSANAL